MHYHLILTEKCNSRCKYCYERSLKDIDNPAYEHFEFDLSPYESWNVNVKKLKKFIEKDPRAVIVFYGGEPLLEISKIIEIMDSIDVPFRMQTNGKLLDQLPAKYVNRIGKILVSLDGTKERTDYNRGEGTYEKVMSNIALIKKNGYKGELIARAAIDFPDVYEQVMALLNAGFTSIHWQLTAGFFRAEYDYETFKKFTKCYNKSTSKLIDFWVKNTEKGKVLRLYPFLGVAESLLKKEKTKLRCGAGYAGYAISTNGKLVACPVLDGIKAFVAGDLNSQPSKLKQFDVSGRCTACEINQICGGRCLYWNAGKSWPEEGDDLICSTIKHLIKELEASLPLIEKAISKGVVKLADVEYEKYFGPEIIP